MTEVEAMDTIRGFLAKQFPKTCANCGRRYETLADYVANTTHTGSPISHDADDDDWRPRQPMGSFAMANCTCGNTLAVTSEGMSLAMMWRLLRWVRTETHRRGISTSDLLADLRDKIDRRILDEAGEG